MRRCYNEAFDYNPDDYDDISDECPICEDECWNSISRIEKDKIDKELDEYQTLTSEK